MLLLIFYANAYNERIITIWNKKYYTEAELIKLTDESIARGKAQLKEDLQAISHTSSHANSVF